MHIGAITFIYVMPLLVLNKNLRSLSGKNSNIKVAGMPTNNEKKIACFTFLYT